MNEARRGELWWTQLGGKRRPVLVISADALNRRLSKIIVLPGTTNLRGWPDELLLPSGVLPSDTAFCCREITPINAPNLLDRAGRAPQGWLEDAYEVLASVLGCTTTR